MSSIYQKGRDGYFYYQAYVFNPESKKKDRRIFHSLGTKDEVEARAKKKKLDYKYNNKKQVNQKFYSSIFQNIYFKSLFFIVSLLCSLVLIFFSNSYEDLNLKNKIIQPENLNVFKNEILTVDKKRAESSIPNKIKIKKESSRAIPLLQVPNDVIEASQIPVYNIERVEKISGSFQQGKITVTISKDVSNQGQYRLCKEIMETYDQFSNIIICVYADTKLGKKLAFGEKGFLSVEEEKDSWLSMFTYNSVEGEYFDNNPNGYLNSN